MERKAKRWLEVPQSLAGCCEFIQHRIQPYYKFWRVLGANMSKWWVSWLLKLIKHPMSNIHLVYTVHRYMALSSRIQGVQNPWPNGFCPVRCLQGRVIGPGEVQQAYADGEKKQTKDIRRYDCFNMYVYYRIVYIYTYTHILYYNLIDQALNDKTWFYICIYIIISYIYAAHAYGHTCTDNARFNLPSGLAYVRQPRRYWWQMLELPRPERQGCEDTTVVALGMLCELSQK